MIKKVVIALIISLVFIIGIAHAELQVEITPTNPVEGEILTCHIYKNGVEVSVDQITPFTIAWRELSTSSSWIPDYIGHQSITARRVGQRWQCAIGILDDDGLGFNPSIYSNIVTVVEPDHGFEDIVFTAVPTSGPVPLNVSFYCQAFGGDESVDYLIRFGDGQVVESDNLEINSSWSVSHVYNEPGVYTAECIANDYDGDSISESIVINVQNVSQNLAPVADFTYSPVQPMVDESVVFNASLSYDPDGEIVGYYWSFSDGYTTTGMIVEHAFTTSGTFYVTLTVIDNENSSDSITKTITVHEPDHEFERIIFRATPTSGLVPLNVTFNCQAIGGDSSVDYLIRFGDGQVVESDNLEINSSWSVSHVYNEPGIYTAICIAEDYDGDTINASVKINVYPRNETTNPIARFNYTPLHPHPGEEVTFDASLSRDTDEVNGMENNGIVRYDWSFGDGSILSTQAPRISHTYVNPGNYTVSLTVTDNDGETATTSMIVSVVPIEQENMAPIVLVEGQTIYQGEEFMPVSLGVSDDQPISMITWRYIESDPNHLWVETIYYNDCNTNIFVRAVKLFTRLIETIMGEEHDPQQCGWFAVLGYDHSWNGSAAITFIAIDIYGASGNDTATFTVLERESPQLHAHAEANGPYYGVVGREVRLSAMGSYGWDGTINSIKRFIWNFGDGTIEESTTPMITHVYDHEGDYTITLIVDDGYTYDTDTAIVHIKPLESGEYNTTTRTSGRVTFISIDVPDIVRRGNDIFLRVGVENNNPYDIEGARVKVSIPGLGVRAGSYIGHMDSGDLSYVSMSLWIPSNARQGVYPVVVEFTNNKGVRKLRHRWIKII